MRKLVTVLAALVVASAAPAWAAVTPAPAPADQEVFTLGEVVVSEENRTVADVSITDDVTAADISATHSLTVPQALQYVPGISVTSGRKNEPNISIHGFDQSQTLILIDGVPYYETNYGKLNLNQIPTDMISRIDVIKGAPSVLYGPNALAGVINIITKKGGLEPTFNASLEASQYSTFHGQATAAGSAGKFNYWFNYNHRESDGYPLSGDFTPKPTTLTYRPGKTQSVVLQGDGKRKNSDYRSDSLWARVGWEPKKGTELYLSGYYIDSQWGFPPSLDSERVIMFRPAFSNLGRMTTYRDWGVDLNARQDIGENWTLRGTLFYHNHIDDYSSYSDTDYNDVIAVSRFKDYAMGGAMYADWRLHPLDTLRFAFHYKADSHKEREDEYLPFTEALSYTGSLAAENEWRPIAPLSVVVGVSYDWFDVDKANTNETDRDGNLTGQEDLKTPDVKSSFNPMIGATYTFDDATQLFASIARKTRFPTLQQLFSSSSGNTKLDPEQSTNYTLGVRRPFLDGKLDLTVAGFYHDVEDMISRDGPDMDSVYRNYSNIKMMGFEAGGTLRPIDGLELGLNYTFNEAKDESDGRVTDKVRGVPKHKIDARVSYTVPKALTRLDLVGMFLSEIYSQLPTPVYPDDEVLETSGYFLMNLKLTQPIGKHFQAFGFVENIFDRDYEMEYGYPGTGRNYWLGVSARW